MVWRLNGKALTIGAKRPSSRNQLQFAKDPFRGAARRHTSCRRVTEQFSDEPWLAPLDRPAKKQVHHAGTGRAYRIDVGSNPQYLISPEAPESLTAAISVNPLQLSATSPRWRRF
jgi:hypothetical protein